MIATEDRVRLALKYMAETDDPAAKAKSLVKGLEQARKTIKALSFLHATGTNGEREATAYASQDYKDAVTRYEDAVYDDELYANKRKTEALIVEVWRSENANRRSGNV